MGVIKPDNDLTHRVMTGQTYAMHFEDFRAMLQIDHIDKEEDAPRSNLRLPSSTS